MLFVLHVCAQEKAALESFLASDALRHAAIGISVKRVRDGGRLLEYNAQMALTPASVAKLIPTALAWEEKGKDFCFRTEVELTGKLQDGILQGNILIRSGGDPCPESRYFPGYTLLQSIVTAVKQAGVREIQGTIVVETKGEKPQIPGSWVWEDIANYYAALYHPFNYRDNAYSLEFRSGKAGEKTELIGIWPKVPGVHFENEVIASEQEGDNAWIFGGPYSQTLYIKGSIPQNRPVFRIKGAMPDPALVFVNELKGRLSKAGIKVTEKVKTDVSPEKRPLLTFTSPSLEKIVFHTNKSSVNLFAEALGTLVAQKGEYERQAKTKFLRIGINPSGITLKDACGLSPLNAVPAEVFTDLLIWANRSLGAAFTSSLPTAGVDKGLNGYCRAYPALKNNLKAKTGSFSGVRCLSGYLTSRSGELLAFTILVNHYVCTSVQIQQEIGAFLNAL